MNQKSKKLFYTLCAMTLLLVVAQLFMSNRLTNEGRIIAKIQTETLALEKENTEIKAKIASLGGLQRSREEALAKGFVKAENVLNLTTKTTVAQKP